MSSLEDRSLPLRPEVPAAASESLNYLTLGRMGGARGWVAGGGYVSPGQLAAGLPAFPLVSPCGTGAEPGGPLPPAGGMAGPVAERWLAYVARTAADLAKSFPAGTTLLSAPHVGLRFLETATHRCPGQAVTVGGLQQGNRASSPVEQNVNRAAEILRYLANETANPCRKRGSRRFAGR